MTIVAGEEIIPTGINTGSDDTISVMTNFFSASTLQSLPLLQE